MAAGRLGANHSKKDHNFVKLYNELIIVKIMLKDSYQRQQREQKSQNCSFIFVARHFKVLLDPSLLGHHIERNFGF